MGRISKSKLCTVLFLVLLASSVCAVYVKVVDGPYVFDDALIWKRPYAQMTELTWESVANVLFEQGRQHRRYLTRLSFALNYYAFGKDPASFHAVNILIHLAGAFGVFCLIRTSLMLPRAAGWEPGRASRAATVGALLFALHPLQTQAVSFIWQRSALLACGLSVWALWMFAQGRRRNGWPAAACYAGSALAAGAALLTKENAILLPFLMLLYHYVFFSPRDTRSLVRHGTVAAAALLAGFALVTALWFHAQTGWGALMERYADRDFSLAQRLLTQPRVLWCYVRTVFVPWPGWLNIDHHVIPSRDFFHPLTTLPALLALGAAVGAGVWSTRLWPVAGFGMLWFWACHIPESTIVPLELMFDHRNYMPLVGLAFVAAIGWNRLFVWNRRVAGGAAATLCLLYAVGTWARNEVYLDEEVFWRDAVAKSPAKARPHMNLGNVLLKRGRTTEAVTECRQALLLQPDYALAHCNLAAALTKQGKLHQAAEHCRIAIRIDLDLVDARNNLGMALLKQGRPEAAMDQFSAMLRINPHNAVAHYNIGVAMQAQGKEDEALRSYRRALEINPHNAEVHNNVGGMLTRRGESVAAVRHFREAVRLKPDYAQAHNNLGGAAARLGEYDEARIHFLDALKIDPNYASAHKNLARLLAIQGNVPQAMPQPQQHVAVGLARRAPGGSGKRNSQNEPTSPGRRP